MANAEVTPAEAGRRGESAIELLERAGAEAEHLVEFADCLSRPAVRLRASRLKKLQAQALELLRNAEDDGK